MTVITPKQHTLNISRSRSSAWVWPRHTAISPALKAGKFGGVGLFVLMLITLIPVPTDILRLALLGPAFLLVSLTTGLLATILAGEVIKTTQQAGEIAWMAGFWAGVFSGISAMIMAAQGILLQNFGWSIARNVTPGLLSGWGVEISLQMMALIGRVFGAFLVYGLISALITAIISTIGSMLFFKLRSLK